jgi:hypothetical protein
VQVVASTPSRFRVDMVARRRMCPNAVDVGSQGRHDEHDGQPRGPLCPNHPFEPRQIMREDIAVQED